MKRMPEHFHICRIARSWSREGHDFSRAVRSTTNLRLQPLGSARYTIMGKCLAIAACITLLAFAGALLLSRPLAAAEPSHTALPDTDNGALFEAFVPVLRHPRCMNCHSKGDYPRQGDDSHPHTMDVRRGPVGFGVTAEKCSTCHQDHNLGAAHLPPGAPGWHLPPPSMPMIWEGLTDAQLCQSIKDPKQNRNRNLNELVEHLTEDKLVAWGWNPGVGRTPVPIPHDEFTVMVKKWQAAGAPCPAM